MTDAPDLFVSDEGGANTTPEDAREPNDGPIWSVRIGDPNLVIPTQPAIWVYDNPDGAVVIRMETMDTDYDDSFVFIRPENIDAVVAQMLRVKAALAG